MALLSIRKFFDDATDEVTSALLRVPGLLLEALSLHAINYDPAEREAFQAALHRLGEDLENVQSRSSVLVLTGEIIRTIQAYQAGLERSIEMKTRELSAIIRLLTEKLVDVASSSSAAAQRLREIEKKIERSVQVDDIRLLKSELTESLNSIRSEAAHHERQSKNVREHAFDLLQSTSGHKRLNVAGEREEDPATGLPTHQAALQALDAALTAGESVVAVVFCLERLMIINQRFGYEAGDRILLLYAQKIAQSLTSSDQLFRWRGPAFLALLKRSAPASVVAAEAKRIAGTRFDQLIDVSGRSVMISVSVAKMTAPLLSYRTVDEVCKLLDGFVADHSRN